MYDLLITNATLLTMAGDGAGYIEDGAVAVEGSKIVAVGPREEVEGNDRARQTIDAGGNLIMPGLVDVHMHSASVIARGLAQEVATWMGSAYGPLVRHIRDEDAPLYTMVALMEGIANGTTTFGDYDAPMNELLASHVALGNRAVVCQGTTEINWADREQWIEQGWRPGTAPPLNRAYGEAGLAAEIALYDRWHGYDNDRIRVIFAPVAADMTSEELLLEFQRVARARNSSIHLHVAQDPRENNAMVERSGLRAIPYLDSIGLLAPDTIAVHMCMTTDDEIELAASRNVRMACCTNSIGIIDGVVPPARRFRELGGVVGLGSDQAPGNNSHNIFAEMRATAMFAKIKADDPTVLPAWQVLRMATIDGARVLGVDDLTGSLEAGKEADLIMIDLQGPPMAPVIRHPARNLVANLVYAQTGSGVLMSMVAGKVIYEDRRFTNVDKTAVLHQLAAAAGEFEAAISADPVVADLPIAQLTRSGLI
ncbi:MAG: amidohydrolase family protein [Thermomicrobiales bacterium]|nr:amidohydrolase family protein [Thermomicrobiales bacterium]